MIPPGIYSMPEFKIKTLQGYIPEEGKVYLLDANVWIFVLRPPATLKPNEQVYVDFFDALVNLATNPKCKNKPTIHMSGLIFSEVCNAHMRANWDIYNQVNGTNLSYKDYRKTADFDKHLNAIKSDFNSYSSTFKFDATDAAMCLENLLTLPKGCDYNDFYYFRVAHKNNFVIVTNDGDFVFPEIEILTFNGQLLKHG